MDPIEATLPCDPTMVRVVRTLANRSGDLAGLGYDRLEDLGLAVDEVGAALIATGGNAPLHTEISHQPGEVRVRMSTATSVTAWPAEDWSASIGALVLESVADEVAFRLDDSRPSVEVVVASQPA